MLSVDRSGRKFRLPLSSLVAGNTPLVSFMFFARNFVAWLAGPNLAARIRVTVTMIVITNRKTRICHNRKVNLLFKRFLTLCFLVSEFVAAG